MEAKKCDRCGDFYGYDDVFTAPSILKNADGRWPETSYCRMDLFYWPTDRYYGIDLCPKCGEQLYNWLNGAKEEAEPEVKDDSRCCETCSHIEFITDPHSRTINKVCTLNRVCPIIEDPGHHLCSRWCPGGGSVTFVRGYCESCKWHRIDVASGELLHKCEVMTTEIQNPNTMTCPNWEEA